MSIVDRNVALSPRHLSLRVHRSSFAGLRLSVDEYYALPDDGNRYELLDGVTVRSPSPTPRHQLILKAVLRSLDDYVGAQRLGVVIPEIDVHLGAALQGRAIVYRPELVFVRRENANKIAERIELVPDVVVEVVSPSSRSMDTETKRDDYERAGVREYWIVDPIDETFTFLRLENGAFVEVAPTGDYFESAAVAGFRLDLAAIRAKFREI